MGSVFLPPSSEVTAASPNAPSLSSKGKNADLALLLHLVEYVASDYPVAVQNGQVKSAQEFREQLDFLSQGLEMVAALPDTLKIRHALALAVTHLHRCVVQKRSPEEVKRTSREVSHLIEASGLVSLVPASYPNRLRATQNYQTYCASCHGASGGGNGVLAQTLDPKPTNFLDNAMRLLPPKQVFLTIRYGIPNTGMPSFPQLSESERWDLAYYVEALRHRSAGGAARRVENGALVSQSNDAELEKFAAQNLLPPSATFLEAQSIVSATRLYVPEENGAGSVGASQGSGPSSGSPATNWRAAVALVRNNLRDGNWMQARASVLSFYLNEVEPKETTWRISDGGRCTQVERLFSELRGQLKIEDRVLALKTLSALEKEVDFLERQTSGQASTGWFLFWMSWAVVLREALEAVLFISILLGLLRQMKSRSAECALHLGWTAALVAGVLSWFALGELFQLSGLQREALEGITGAVAVLVLLTLGFWLHQKTEVQRWHQFVKSKFNTALGTRRLMGVAAAGFIAVFREAFETILFLKALLLEAVQGPESGVALQGGSAVFAGLLAALVCALGLGILVSWYCVKLPLKRLFQFSSALLFVLALVLAGKATHSFQEIGWISTTSLRIPISQEVLGLYPSWETVLLQVGMAVMVAAVFIVTRNSTRESKGSEIAS